MSSEASHLQNMDAAYSRSGVDLSAQSPTPRCMASGFAPLKSGTGSMTRRSGTVVLSAKVTVSLKYMTDADEPMPQTASPIIMALVQYPGDRLTSPLSAARARGVQIFFRTGLSQLMLPPEKKEPPRASVLIIK